MTAPAALTAGPLEARDLKRLLGLAGRLPLGWTRTVRRRRWLLLALAAPGFVAVAAAPLHRNLALLVLGLLAFAAALVFRARSEPVFVRAEAAALWPPQSRPPSKEPSHA